MFFYMTDLGAFLLSEEKLERKTIDCDVLWDNFDSNFGSTQLENDGTKVSKKELKSQFASKVKMRTTHNAKVSVALHSGLKTIPVAA